MKQYKMPFILGCVALILAALSLIVGVVELVRHGMTTNAMFAAIIFIGGSLSAFNLMRLHKQLKNRKPPEAKTGPDNPDGETQQSPSSKKNY